MSSLPWFLEFLGGSVTHIRHPWPERCLQAFCGTRGERYAWKVMHEPEHRLCAKCSQAAAARSEWWQALAEGRRP